MISTEEKLEIMQRERTAYKTGYRDGLRWTVAVIALCLIGCAVLIIMIL